MKRLFCALRNERGLTFVEQVITLLIIGLVVLAWVNAYRYVTKGSVSTKSNLRVQNVAMTRLEDAKELMTSLAMAGSWESITQNAMVQAYATTQVAYYEGRPITWRVTTAYASMSYTGMPVAYPVPETYTAGLSDGLLLYSEVYWTQDGHPFSLTMTGYVSNPRQ